MMQMANDIYALLLFMLVSIGLAILRFKKRLD